MFVLLTPAHNESDNVAGLIECVRASQLRPDRWIVIDDRSSDDTAARFRDLGRDLNVEVIPSGTTGGYMGFRYSEVLLAGVRALGDAQVDALGILDCDIRFGPGYWANLQRALLDDPRLGIVSGALCAPDGDGYRLEDGQRIDLPRGGLRLVKGACWAEVGLTRSRAPDSHQTARARSRGWRTRLLEDELAWSVRPTDSRGEDEDGWESRGRRAFEIGQPGWQVAVRALGVAAGGRRRAGLGLVRGYLRERREGERTDDADVRRYYRRERPREWLRSLRARVTDSADPHRYLPSRRVEPPR